MRAGLGHAWVMAALLSIACQQQSGIEAARSEARPLVEAACDWMFSCCSDGELVYQLGEFTVGPQDCSARLLEAIEAGVPLELEQQLSDDPAHDLLVLALAINEERIEPNSEAIEQCASVTAAMACNVPSPTDDDERCTPDDLEPDDPCDPALLFEGVQDVGELCYGTWECKAGLHCIDYGLAGVCAARVEAGGTCFSDAECGEGLICDWRSGQCSTGAQLGQACAFSDPGYPAPGTESIRCGEGLACDPATLTCVGGYCAPGAFCDDIFGESDCPTDYYCIGNSFTQATCRLQGDLGAPCYEDDDCLSGACDQNDEVCVNLLALGDNCFDHDQCDSGFCGFGVCAPALPPGQPCMSYQDEECEAGYCDTNLILPICTAYSGEGGGCLFGNECDPALGLWCIDMVCLLPPFADGAMCFNGSQCESSICFANVCSPGASVGAPCTTDFSTEPCAVGTFCDAPAGAINGNCAPLRRTGEPCDSPHQCWGQCVVRFGVRMCDETPAYELDELWCDGQ